PRRSSPFPYTTLFRSLGAEPAGEGVEFTYGVTMQGRLSRVEEFEDIIVRANPDGSALRLRDVARLELGAQNYQFTATFNGEPTVDRKSTRLNSSHVKI